MYGLDQFLRVVRKRKRSSLSRVWLFVTPWTWAHQAPLSIGFSRSEYWSGLPYPSPEDLPYPGIEPRSPALQANFLPTEPQGKPKNTGKGSLSLLQWILPTQELNQGLLHCRQMLYHLNHQGSPQGRGNNNKNLKETLLGALYLKISRSHIGYLWKRSLTS